jgi:5-oxoprolinase (ATP-hydrolysing)
MPPFSHTLDEEGVVLRAFPLVRGGKVARHELLRTLAEEPNPARAPLTNLADLEAQIAANRKGEELLAVLVAERGLDTVDDYMEHLQNDAALAVEQAIRTLSAGVRSFADSLDEGASITVRLEVRNSRLLMDFTGTSLELNSNLNAPRAVTHAAVLYVLRALVGRPIPLNGGCFAPIDLSSREEASFTRPRSGRSWGATWRPPSASWTCCAVHWISPPRVRAP